MISDAERTLLEDNWTVNDQTGLWSKWWNWRSWWRGQTASFHITDATVAQAMEIRNDPPASPWS